MSGPTADLVSESLQPLIANPGEAAIFCDIDGTLAPIVERPDQAQVPEQVSKLLAGLGRRYGCVACVSGRSVAEARRLVGVGSIAYAGSHGAELLEPGSSTSRLLAAFGGWEGRVRRFASEEETTALRVLRIRIEDKGPITAFHWRGVPDEEAALTHLEAVAQRAEAEGLWSHWGRKVLEVRPPVPIDKGQAVAELVDDTGARAALFGGDDTTDLDAFDTLEALREHAVLDHVVKVGVRSEEGPAAIVERADLIVDGVAGFTRVLATLAEV